MGEESTQCTFKYTTLVEIGRLYNRRRRRSVPFFLLNARFIVELFLGVLLLDDVLMAHLGRNAGKTKIQQWNPPQPLTLKRPTLPSNTHTHTHIHTNTFAQTHTFTKHLQNTHTHTQTNKL